MFQIFRNQRGGAICALPPVVSGVVIIRFNDASWGMNLVSQQGDGPDGKTRGVTSTTIMLRHSSLLSDQVLIEFQASVAVKRVCKPQFRKHHKGL